jgi:hypothetical protein
MLSGVRRPTAGRGRAAATVGRWLASVAVAGAGVATVNALVYGGPLTSGYAPGEVTFGLSAVLPNLRYLPIHLIEAMPVLVLGLVGMAWIARRWRATRTDESRRDLAVAVAVAASWLSLWALYATYTWTTNPGASTLQVVRFYVPAAGAIALLGAWALVRLAHRRSAPPSRSS